MNDLQEHDDKTEFLKTKVNKIIILLNAGLALIYFFVLTFWFPSAHPVLFWLLVASEIFHIWLSLTFLYTIWETDPPMPVFDETFAPPVNVFITVAGEPVEVVEETVIAAKNMDYPNFDIYILNDGFILKKDNWQDMIKLAQKHGINCITRTVPGGAKAGNINNGLRLTHAPLVAIFDADHVPHPDFLSKTAGYFIDPKMGFVQSPQYYKNHRETYVASAAWAQQALFFGPICKGKNRLNSVTMCGTNMVISREALNEVGGVVEDNIAEDFLTGLKMHKNGRNSVYVPEVLAEGLAPEDLLTYAKQQFRWARGSLEVVFRHNPIFSRGLTWAQKIQYISSATFFLSGEIVILNAIFPLIFFFFGIVPLQVSTMALAIAFLPYILLTVFILKTTSNNTFSFRALAFCMSQFVIHLKALGVVLLGQTSVFDITLKKQRASGRYAKLVVAHVGYIILVIAGVFFAIRREGLSVSVITNFSWAAFNVSVFLPFINAALPESAPAPLKEIKSRTAISLKHKTYADKL